MDYIKKAPITGCLKNIINILWTFSAASCETLARTGPHSGLYLLTIGGGIYIYNKIAKKITLELTNVIDCLDYIIILMKMMMNLMKRNLKEHPSSRYL